MALSMYHYIFEQQEALRHILPCQFIGAKLPEQMGIAERGMQIFKEVDARVDIKYGHKA